MKNLDLEELRGQQRLGTLSFEQAPTQIKRVIKLFDDLKEEDQDELDPAVLQNLTNQLTDVANIAEEMRTLSAEAPDVHPRKQDLENRLLNQFNALRTTIRPMAVRAVIKREVGRRPVRGESAQLKKDMEELRSNFEVLREERNRLAHALEEQSDLVQATREAAGQSGAAELSTDYERQANRHAAAWKVWGVALLAALVGSLVAGVVLYNANHPSPTASNGEIAASIVLDALVLGLLLYLVRITALQFRVHRHLEAVGRNKAAALSTFNRIAAAVSDQDVRTAVVTVLAQSVFTSDETGFVDASGDHVTLVEKLVAPVTDRVRQR